jgi:hypothetical protein
LSDGSILLTTARPPPLFVVVAFESEIFPAVAEETIVEPFVAEVFADVGEDERA